MRFKKNNGTYFTLAFQEYEPIIKINYELIALSSNRVRSIDRGVSTDRYATKLTVIGKKSYITELLVELDLLRANNKPVIIDQCQEAVFGDHIDYSAPISCVIFGLEDENSRALNSYSVEFTLLASTVSYKLDATLPTGLRCLAHTWTGTSRMNASTNETYNRTNYYVNRVEDTFLFKGTYTLTAAENASLLNFWKVNRGNNIEIDETDFGVTNMFGALGGLGTHTVVIEGIETEQLGSIYRTTTIKLIKVK